jgi:uncharacterized protein with PIN domain
MILFVDTSALVKLFYSEQGTEIVTELLTSKGNEIWISELSKLEFVSTVYRKYREGRIDNEQLQTAISGFNSFILNHHIEFLNSEVMDEAQGLLQRFGKNLGLRTLDSIQLATYNFLCDTRWFMLVADTILAGIARSMGFNVINPLE